MNSMQERGLDNIAETTDHISRVLKPYRVVLFVVFVALIYGFVLQRISSLVHAEPSEQAISSQVQTTKLPRIDPKIVQQLQALEDNSVSVKTLFNEARSNPFQ
jgi:hypothetical protein